MKQQPLFEGRTTLFPRSPRQKALGKAKQQDDAKLAESRAWFEHLQKVAEGRKQAPRNSKVL